VFVVLPRLSPREWPSNLSRSNSPVIGRVELSQPVSSRLRLPRPPCSAGSSSPSVTLIAFVAARFRHGWTTTAIERYLNGNFEAYLGNWSGRADPDATLVAFFGCSGAQNVNKYCDKGVARRFTSR
jgi:hypothetical protein